MFSGIITLFPLGCFFCSSALSSTVLNAPWFSFQALLESMGANGSTGPEAVAAAEKSAALLTARAGARDPSAIPSICRISAALQYPAGQLLFIFAETCFSVLHLDGVFVSVG